MARITFHPTTPPMITQKELLEMMMYTKLVMRHELCFGNGGKICLSFIILFREVRKTLICMSHGCFHLWKMVKVTHLLKGVQWNEIIKIVRRNCINRAGSARITKSNSPITSPSKLPFLCLLHVLKCPGLDQYIQQMWILKEDLLYPKVESTEGYVFFVLLLPF